FAQAVVAGEIDLLAVHHRKRRVELQSRLGTVRLVLRTTPAKRGPSAGLAGVSGRKLARNGGRHDPARMHLAPPAIRIVLGALSEQCVEIGDGGLEAGI